ncbi:MAG: YceI family protein [Proteobacteria bacterium]|nr:YceI family protein [Pseudomonadota bacterium]
MRPIRMLPLLPCLGLLCGAALAQVPRHESHDLDAGRSQAGFTVKLLWLIGLRGDFGAVRGTLDIDRFHGTARVDARIDVDDLHMRSANYEAWAKSAEFFDASRYAQIHFVSEDIPLVRLSRGGALDGLLTLRGIDKPVRFRILPAQCGQPLTGACAVQAEGSIERNDFGMHSRRGTLADKVALRMRIFVLPDVDRPQ